MFVREDAASIVTFPLALSIGRLLTRISYRHLSLPAHRSTKRATCNKPVKQQLDRIPPNISLDGTTITLPSSPLAASAALAGFTYSTWHAWRTWWRCRGRGAAASADRGGSCGGSRNPARCSPATHRWPPRAVHRVGPDVGRHIVASHQFPQNPGNTRQIFANERTDRVSATR